MEKWKDIPQYEGRYRVSDQGRVWDAKKKMIREPRVTANGYRAIKFARAGDGHTYHWKISRLVFLVFNGALVKGMVVDHRDMDKQNDKASNLQQITHRDNISRSIPLSPSRPYPGVRVSPSGKYRARIRLGREQYTLGTFFHAKSAYRAILRAIRLFDDTGITP